MNKKRYPKSFLSIICLAILLNNGCLEFPKGRPPTSLKNPVSHYNVKPSVYFLTSFQHMFLSGMKYEYSSEDDTLRKIVQKVIMEYELFDWYSSGEASGVNADFIIDLKLNNYSTSGDELKPHQVVMGLLWGMTFSLSPIPDEMEYVLKTSLRDRSGKELYSYTCTNESTATQYSLFPPTGMIKKMVKEALFNVIDNSEIIKSYKIQS